MVGSILVDPGSAAKKARPFVRVVSPYRFDTVDLPRFTTQMSVDQQEC
jgi:hypothetical protein